MTHPFSAVPVLLALLLAGSCAFLDPRTPCADDDECPGQNTCLADGFCTLLDGGPAAVDAGENLDGGGDVGDIDAGDIDAGDIDAGDIDAGDIDAGDIDAGDIDAGDIDAGNIDAGDIDAGDIDAGDIDAGDIDAGRTDAGADAGETDGGFSDCPPGGIPFDADNCGACGHICASGSCSVDVCVPNEIGRVTGLATSFALDGERLHAYYARSETQLYRFDIGSGEPPLLLETNVDIVDIALEGSVIAATSKGPVEPQLLTGTLPIDAVGVLTRSEDELEAFTDITGDKYGLSLTEDFVLIGQETGRAEFDVDQQVLTHISTGGRYFPRAFGLEYVFAFTPTGSFRVWDRSQGEVLPPPEGSAECQEGFPSLSASAAIGFRHYYGGTCDDEGAGVFIVETNGNLDESVSLTRVDSNNSARVVALAPLDGGVFVGLQFGLAYALHYVSSEGETRAVIQEEIGNLAGLGTDGEALYIAEGDIIADETRFLRLQALP